MPNANAEWTPGAAAATAGIALMILPIVPGTAPTPGEIAAWSGADPAMSTRSTGSAPISSRATLAVMVSRIHSVPPLVPVAT